MLHRRSSLQHSQNLSPITGAGCTSQQQEVLVLSPKTASSQRLSGATWFVFARRCWRERISFSDPLIVQPRYAISCRQEAASFLPSTRAMLVVLLHSYTVLLLLVEEEEWAHQLRLFRPRDHQGPLLPPSHVVLHPLPSLHTANTSISSSDRL